MAVLDAALTPVRMGFGTLVELVGDAGIGKSRIVEEIRSRAADMRPLSAACEQYKGSTPYFVFRDLLRDVVDVEFDGKPTSNTERLRERLEPVAPELLPWIPLLAVPLDVEVAPTREVEELQPAFRRARLHGVVATLLERLLEEPTLILLEDVHWMDEASAELLRHIAGRVLTAKPWLACATRRPDGGGFSAAEGTPPVPALTIRLDPLPEEDAKALVVAAAGEALHEHEVAAIMERAGGNPLFLRELVAASGFAETEEELPETVEAVVSSRIDRLAPADRTLLRWASVLGHAFPGDVVGDVLAGDPEAAADSEAWDRLGEFVERDPEVAGGFRFRHALIRDAAYQGLSFARRAELHGRVAAVLEARPDADPALLSLHFLRADDHAKAWTYALAAGERAQAKFANVEAAGFYRRALDAARRLPDLEPRTIALAWESLGDVAQLAGHYAEADEAFDHARRLVEKGSPDDVSLMLKEGIIRERMGRYPAALRWYSRALKAVEALPPGRARTVDRIELGLASAAARFRQGKFDDCIDWCRRVVDDAGAIEYLPGLAHAYYLLHVSYTELGSPDRVAFRGLALPIYEELGDLLGQAQVLNNLGIDAYYEGRWDDALDLYRRSREARERIGDVVGGATVTNNIGEIKSDQGHLEAAEQHFVEVHAGAEASGNRLLAILATSNLGRVAARSGRLDDARRLLEEALAGFEEIGSGGFVLEAEARLAEVSLFAGAGEAALRRAEETLARTEAGGAPAVLAAALHRVRGAALRMAGDLAGARLALAESLSVSRALAAGYETAQTLAELARLDGAVEHAQEAAAIFERLGVVSVDPGADTV
jgi:tetratricopeptide (TPR) repeat protein